MQQLTYAIFALQTVVFIFSIYSLIKDRINAKRFFKKIMETARKADDELNRATKLSIEYEKLVNDLRTPKT